jgi:hypothetical protein
VSIFVGGSPREDGEGGDNRTKANTAVTIPAASVLQ